MGNIESTHIKIKEYLSSFDRVSTIDDLLHNHNISFFSAKYDEEDKYNYKKFQINVEWYSNTIFIPDIVYIQFESNDEIFKQIDNVLN